MLETIIEARGLEKFYGQPGNNAIQVIAPTDISVKSFVPRWFRISCAPPIVNAPGVDGRPGLSTSSSQDTGAGRSPSRVSLHWAPERSWKPSGPLSRTACVRPDSSA